MNAGLNLNPQQLVSKKTIQNPPQNVTLAFKGVGCCSDGDCFERKDLFQRLETLPEKLKEENDTPEKLGVAMAEILLTSKPSDWYMPAIRNLLPGSVAENKHPELGNVEIKLSKDGNEETFTYHNRHPTPFSIGSRVVKEPYFKNGSYFYDVKTSDKESPVFKLAEKLLK